MASDLPVTVVGGYLGAGKTTLLNHLLTNTQGLRLAVLVNDFGDVNIDASLIASHAGETLALTNGCMCCSLVNGFAQAIGEVLRHADRLDHIVIEASGVADPAKIAQYGQMYGMPLDGVLVVADAERVQALATDKYVGDTVLRQLRKADLVVLNKMDLVADEARRAVGTWLGEHAPGTPVVEAQHGSVPVEVLLGAGRRRGAAQGEADVPTPSTGRHPSYTTHTIRRSAAVRRETLAAFAASLGPSVYRAKGFVHLDDDPTVRHLYQQVGSRWTLRAAGTWEGAPPCTVIVVIGRSGAVDRADLEGRLDGRAAEAEVASTALPQPGLAATPSTPPSSGSGIPQEGP